MVAHVRGLQFVQKAVYLYSYLLQPLHHAMSATLRLPVASRLERALWQADRLQTGGAVQPSGHSVLDAELPGGGWPLGTMTEILQPEPLHAEWQLLLPALLRQLHEQQGGLVLVGMPHWPYAPALQALALPVQRMVVVPVRERSQVLWSAEQAVRCPEVAAVLLWQSAGVDMASLRRLQLAAQGQASLLLILLRTQAGQEMASPAPLRLRLRHDIAPSGTAPALGVDILKRRGPPCLHTVWLPWQAIWLTGAAGTASTMATRSAEA